MYFPFFVDGSLYWKKISWSIRHFLASENRQRTKECLFDDQYNYFMTVKKYIQRQSKRERETWDLESQAWRLFFSIVKNSFDVSLVISMTLFSQKDSCFSSKREKGNILSKEASDAISSADKHYPKGTSLRSPFYSRCLPNETRKEKISQQDSSSKLKEKRLKQSKRQKDMKSYES